MADTTRTDRSRGAAMVEFALVAVLLFTLVAGVVDLGLGWRRSVEASSTLRSGARVISSLGADRSADQEALRAINAGIAEIGSTNVSRVIVYESSTADGSVPASCLSITPSATGAGQNGVCNVYGEAQLSTLGANGSRFSGDPDDCQGDDWDRFYCPVDREDEQAEGTDYVGIYMEFTIDWMFGFLPDSMRNGDDDVVMRIEPTG